MEGDTEGVSTKPPNGRPSASSSIKKESPTEIPKNPLLEMFSLGEFGHAKLTQAELDKLTTKLNGSRDTYIANFDRWVHEAPLAKHNGVKRQDRNAYASICSWYYRDVKEGKVKSNERKNIF
jgi:hypothetical protein